MKESPANALLGGNRPSLSRNFRRNARQRGRVSQAQLSGLKNQCAPSFVTLKVPYLTLTPHSAAYVTRVWKVSKMEGLLWPILSAVLVLAGTYYYFVVMNKPKKLASVPAPMVKKGTAAAQKRKPAKKKEEVRDER